MTFIQLYPQKIFYFLVTLLKCLKCQYLAKTFAKQSTNPNAWKEKDLIKELLNDYDKRSRPVVDGVSPFAEVFDKGRKQYIQQVTVEFGLSLIQIMELDEMDQILTSNVRTLYVRIA